MTNALDRGQCLATQVLEQLPTTLNNSHEPWRINPLGQGEQALLYLAHKTSALENLNELVLKIYKCASANDEIAFEHEVQTLKQIHKLLNGWQHRHWTFETPALYNVSQKPLAMAMSRVRGVAIQSWLRSATMSAEAEAVVAALKLLWSHDVLYGDLNLKNILYDPAQSVISFVDPGLPEDFFRCDNVAADWYPASRDLAYLAFSVAVSFKSTLANPSARRRQLSFVRAILLQYLYTVDCQEKQQAFINEVRSCASIHVEQLTTSFSPAGLWRMAVKRLTQRCLDAMFTSLLGTSVSVNHAR